MVQFVRAADLILGQREASMMARRVVVAGGAGFVFVVVPLFVAYFLSVLLSPLRFLGLALIALGVCVASFA